MSNSMIKRAEANLGDSGLGFLQAHFIQHGSNVVVKQPAPRPMKLCELTSVAMFHNYLPEWFRNMRLPLPAQCPAHPGEL